MSLKKNQWRVNCGIVYKDAGEIPFCRIFVHELLTSIAITLKLEYAIVEDFSGFLVPEEEHSETKSEFCMDIFCFRAFERTRNTDKGFPVAHRQTVLTFIRSFRQQFQRSPHLAKTSEGSSFPRRVLPSSFLSVCGTPQWEK